MVINYEFTIPLSKGYNVRKVNCSCVNYAYILKPISQGGISKQQYMHQIVRLVFEEVKSTEF